MTEAFHLIGDSGAARLKDLSRRGVLTLSFDLGDQLEPVLGLLDNTRTSPMSLADACLVRMSETLPDPLVVTTDADFKIYRRHGRHVVPCLIP